MPLTRWWSRHAGQRQRAGDSQRDQPVVPMEVKNANAMELSSSQVRERRGDGRLLQRPLRDRGDLRRGLVYQSAAEYTRLVANAGLSAVLELRDEDFGQRHFIITDPVGNLVDVIENVPPSHAFEAVCRRTTS